MDRVTARLPVVVLPAVALWSMLGSQGARLGSYLVPPLSPWWVAAAAIAAIGLARGAARERGALSRRGRTLAGGLFVAFLALSLWRDAALSPPLDVAVAIEDGRIFQAGTLQIPERRYLRRLTDARRDVALEARAVLRVPVDGSYRFDVVCDDRCTIDIGPHRLEARGSVSRTFALTAGEIPFHLRYRQGGGPAVLLFAWDSPRWVELLPIEHYLHGATGPGDAEASARARSKALAALVLLVAWWAVLAASLREIAPLSRHRYVPLAAAAVVGLYGGMLRVEAFLAHSRLAETDTRAARWHEAILPFTPAFSVFNPENAPEDPYRADVRSYLDRAEAMSSLGAFYAPAFREPLYVALTKPFLAAARGEIGILVQSLVFSILTMPLVYLVAFRAYGPWWALGLLVPVALNEWLVLEAPSGYRMSAYGFFLVAFVSVTFWSRSPALAGLFGGALCLIRLSALSVVAPLLVLGLSRQPPGERRRYGGIAFALVVALLGPFLVSNYRAHGDPFYAVSFHTEFWLRAEGLDEGQGAVGVTSYFTDFGRGRALVQGTLLGMTVLPVRTFARGLSRFPLLGIAVIGLGIAGLLMPRWFFLAAYLGQLVPFAYIQNFPSGEMPRFVMPAFLVLVLALPSSTRVVGQLRKRLGRPRASSSPASLI